MADQRIVADGRKRAHRSKEHRQHRDEIIAEIRSRYEPQLRTAGPFKRLRLRLRMRRDICRTLDQLAPKHGCY